MKNIRMMTIQECLQEIDFITNKEPICFNDQIKLDNLYLRLNALKAQEQISKQVRELVEDTVIHYNCNYALA